MNARRPARIFALELRNELLKLGRMPGFAVPALGFPLMFYVLFGLVLPSSNVGGSKMTTYLLATYGIFGVLGVAMFSLGAGLAMERGQGWQTVRRVMPSSPMLHLAARLAVAGLFGLLIGVGLVLIGAVFGGVRLPTASWAALLAIIAASALPFGAVGFGLGQLLGPNSAAGVINAVYLPMSFLSGLWVPIAFLPAFLQRLAVVFPPYHAAQLALTAIGAPHQESVGMALGSLVVLTVIATGFASFAARRADSRTWG